MERLLMLETRDLYVSLKGRKILSGVNFSVQRGEVTGLIGPNGAGKSTLMKVLAGVLSADSGHTLIQGVAAHQWKRQHRARTIGYLPQGQAVHWPLEVQRLVALGRLPHLMPWQALQSQDEHAIFSALEKTDTLPLKKRSMHELAGGEKSLVMLARVLAGEPELILADEPVAGLDPRHELQVMELLRDYAKSGRAVVTVMHHLALAARFCDRLFLMYEGKICASGSPREVLTPEHLDHVYGIRAHLHEEDNALVVLPWKRLR